MFLLANLAIIPQGFVIIFCLSHTDFTLGIPLFYDVRCKLLGQESLLNDVNSDQIYHA